ncbi:unnamed protein product, partial [Ilex paraguariensis]
FFATLALLFYLEYQPLGGNGASSASAGRLGNTYGVANSDTFGDVTRGSEGGDATRGIEGGVHGAISSATTNQSDTHGLIGDASNAGSVGGDVGELGDAPDGFGDVAGLTGGTTSMPQVIDWWLGATIASEEVTSGDIFNHIRVGLGLVDDRQPGCWPA